MSRLDTIFRTLKGQRRKGLIAYVTAGDPDLAATAEMLPAMASAGADVCEIGFPFSDPLADGPTIQDSMTHALSRGLRIEQVFDMVAGLRSKLAAGLVAMVSYSIVYRRDPQKFIDDAARAGFDGLIFPDLPLGEATQVREMAAAADISCILLIAPTTPLQRARQIAAASSGFVYLMARAGVTGQRSALPADLPPRIQQLRQVTDLPIAVGFGISTAQQVRQVVQYADAAIVGSAIVSRLVEHRQDRAEAIRRAVALVGELVGGLTASDQRQEWSVGTSPAGGSGSGGPAESGAAGS